MELEVKHLAPYLPYGLKLQYVVRENVEKTGIMKSITHNEDEMHPTKVSIDFCDSEHIWMFKPILRPLSDLTKEIQIAEHYMTYKEHIQRMFPSESIHTNIATWSYRVVDWLFEKHFDVFGLIQKGLAIDINTLKND